MGKKPFLSTSILIISSLITLGSCTGPDCSNTYPGQFVSDPDNCHNYYICPEGGGNSNTCPDGGCFVPVGYCAEASSSYCSSHCTDMTTVSSTTIAASTTSSSGSTISTSNSVTTSTTDTETTSSLTSSSSSPSTDTVMCGNQIPGTMIPDPINCRDYFLCTDAGEWLLVPCPGNGCFLGALNTCYDNDDYCNSFCGDDLTTTTMAATTEYSTTATTLKSTTATQESTTTMSSEQTTLASTEESSIASTMMTTSSTEIPDDCYDINHFWCPGEGYIAKCNYCTPEYFYCHSHGDWAHEGVCAWPLVFNPDPAYPHCVPDYYCPYHPDIPVTTTPDPISGCTDINDFYCPGHGYYAKCDYCVPEYYHCNHYGGHPTQGQCSGHMMFNPDPHYPYCVEPFNCPYHH